MKSFFAAFLLLGAVAVAADQPAPAAPVPPGDEYSRFIARLATREALTDCINVMDRLIEAGEHGLVDKEPDPGMVGATTAVGLQFDFSTTDAGQAILYYLKVSRGGQELKYSDAAKLVAVFTDRAGLPHPINVTEGDKHTFYAQWVIKPSEWKKMWKMMKKVRAENRAIKDPAHVFALAIEREMEARARAQVRD